MIIVLGYRLRLQVATRFRVWGTQRLHEYIQKGFTMDDERLKQGGSRYFREFLQIEGKGKISQQEAIEKVEKEFELYREKEMKQLESDFDKMIKMLNNNSKNKYEICKM